MSVCVFGGGGKSEVCHVELLLWVSCEDAVLWIINLGF